MSTPETCKSTSVRMGSYRLYTIKDEQWDIVQGRFLIKTGSPHIV